MRGNGRHGLFYRYLERPHPENPPRTEPFTRSSQLVDAGALTIDPQGNLYVLLGTVSCQKIFKIDPLGHKTQFAGTDAFNPPIQSGCPATETALHNVSDLEFGSDQCLYLTEFWGFGIRKIDQAGIITTVAGGGSKLYSAAWDGSPATEANIPNAKDMTCAPNGTSVRNLRRVWPHVQGRASASGIFR